MLVFPDMIDYSSDTTHALGTDSYEPNGPQYVCIGGQLGVLGGFFQLDPAYPTGNSSVPNPVTGQFNCPQGYKAIQYGIGNAQISSNVYDDVKQYYCIKNDYYFSLHELYISEIF